MTDLDAATPAALLDCAADVNEPVESVHAAAASNSAAASSQDVSDTQLAAPVPPVPSTTPANDDVMVDAMWEELWQDSLNDACEAASTSADQEQEKAQEARNPPSSPASTIPATLDPASDHQLDGEPTFTAISGPTTASSDGATSATVQESTLVEGSAACDTPSGPGRGTSSTAAVAAPSLHANDGTPDASVAAAAAATATAAAEATAPAAATATAPTSPAAALRTWDGAGDAYPDPFRIAPNRNKKIVRSYGEALLFQEDSLHIVRHEYGTDALTRMADSYGQRAISSAFSGIRGAETADEINHAVLEHELNCKIPKRPSSWMIEWDKRCIDECLPIAKLHGSCYFSNIADFYKPEMKQYIDQFLKKPRMVVEVLAEIFQEGDGPMQLYAHCLTHGKKCKICTTNIHLAGTSCHPYAKRGAHQGLADPEIVYTIAWVLLVPLKLEVDDITSENVEDEILLTMLSRFCKHLYWIDLETLDPVLYGYPFARRRSMIRLRHRVKLLPQISPVSNFNKLFHRACDFEWKAAWFMMMENNQGIETIKDERNVDIASKQRKKSSKSFDSTPLLADDDDAFFRVLTAADSNQIIAYQRAWPGQAYQLNQNTCQPGKSTEWCLQTLIHNFGDLWLDDLPGGQARRWMFATEALLTMGFPVVPLFQKRYGKDIGLWRFLGWVRIHRCCEYQKRL